MRIKSKAGTAVVIIIVIATLIYAGNLVFSGAQETKINLSDNKIKIDAMFGVDVDYSDVESITLIDKSMNEIEPEKHRDNGYGGVGDTLKGYFSSDALGKFMLFVEADSSPTIRLQRKSDTDIYISLSDSEATKALYNNLIENVPID